MSHHDADENATTPDRPARPWCLFQCGPASYALGLESVAEVVEVERLVRLPHSPARIVGLCALRREVIPVVELNEPSYGQQSNHSPERLLLLILKTSRGHWGIRIEAEGTNVAEEPLSPWSTSEWPHRSGFLGEVQHGGISYLVIDPEATWQNVRQGVDDGYKDRTCRDTVWKNPSSPSSLATLAG